jgi:hypothetical protein
MSFSNVNIGSGNSTGDGDSLRRAFEKINQNFANIAESRFEITVNSAVMSVNDQVGDVLLTVSDITGAASQGYADTKAEYAIAASRNYTDNKVSLLSSVIDDKIGTSISNLIDSAPSNLNSLRELAEALNDDAGFAANISSRIYAVESSIESLSIGTSSGLDEEISARISSDTDLQIQITAISANVASLQANDTLLENNKADVSTVNDIIDELATKANTSTVNDIIDELATKASISTVEAIDQALADKVDRTEVEDIIAQQGNFVTIDQQGRLVITNGASLDVSSEGTSYSDTFFKTYDPVGALFVTAKDLVSNGSTNTQNYTEIGHSFVTQVRVTEDLTKYDRLRGFNSTVDIILDGQTWDAWTKFATISGTAFSASAIGKGTISQLSGGSSFAFAKPTTGALDVIDTTTTGDTDTDKGMLVGFIAGAQLMSTSDEDSIVDVAAGFVPSILTDNSTGAATVKNAAGLYLPYRSNSSNSWARSLGTSVIENRYSILSEDPTAILYNAGDITTNNSLIVGQSIIFGDGQAFSGYYNQLKEIPQDLVTQSSLDDEASQRSSADQELQDQIDNITNNVDPAALDSLAEIVAAFQGADSNLNNAITNLSASATSGLALKANIADLSLVATTNNYNDLNNLPTIPTIPSVVSVFSNDAGYLVASDVAGKVDAVSLAPVATSGSYLDLEDLPTNVSSFVNDANYLTSYTETNDLTAAVTWATVPDSYVSSSSVTQHQANISITESQISDLGSYLTADSELAFAKLTGLPSTLDGYGITDAFDGQYSSLAGAPVLATVATSGDYNDLVNKPTSNFTFANNTIGVSTTDSSITIDANGAGEIVMNDRVGIKQSNPGLTLHIGSVNDSEPTVGVAITYGNDNISGTASLQWDWNDGIGAGSNTSDTTEHARFGIFKNDALGHAWLTFDQDAPANALAVTSTGELLVSGTAVALIDQVSKVTTVPVTSLGQAGDVTGMIANDANYHYYCTSDYDGVTDIWRRVAWGSDTW